MQSTQYALRRSGLIFFALIFSLVFAFPHRANAQDGTLEQQKAKATELFKQNNMVAALPVLEKIIQADAADADMQFYYGFALLAKAINVTNNAERKQLRFRARNAFVKSKELGNTLELVSALIQSIPPDGGETGKYSANESANTAMDDGEKAFTAGKFDEALVLYQKALKLDPKIYEAALYSGDMYFRKNDYPNAEIFYQKAIVINPNRETAYRYSATPLMKQGKTTEARDRYIEAFITEPYSRFALSGLVQWGEATDTRLGHPVLDIPEFKTGADGKTNSTIKINPTDDGSTAWIAYTAARSEWRNGKFAKNFPAEKTYRHTLREEAEALHSVAVLSKDLQKKSNALNPQLQTLINLDQDGLLEAYILLATPDKDLAQDYAGYLSQNRAKLRQYMVKYVVLGK